jgi:predicted nucleic acid-binding Zn ribbon protein
VDRITSMDMNKAIQRSLTKALARHGLGLYIYAGEDLPWTEEEAAEREEAAKEQAAEYARQDKKVVKKAPAKKQKAAPAPAPAAPAPAPQKKQLTKEEQHAKWVVAIATGWVSKMGVPAMEAWKANVHPDEDQIAAMEDEVFNYRIDHNIKADQTNVNA